MTLIFLAKFSSSSSPSSGGKKDKKDKKDKKQKNPILKRPKDPESPSTEPEGPALSPPADGQVDRVASPPGNYKLPSREASQSPSIHNGRPDSPDQSGKCNAQSTFLFTDSSS